jgi:pilus assembly protein CpaE
VTESTVIAVGSPPTFRGQVARALGQDAESVEWTATVSAAESSLVARKNPANVVVLSPAVKELDAFGLSDFVSKTSPASAVVLVRERLSNGILPAAMRSGIREVIDLSKGGEELREALERAHAWSENLLTVQGTGALELESDRGKVTTVFSSKGGTGKSFLSSGMALALARETGEDVALLDMEFGVGDTLSYFGKEPTHPLQDLLSVGDLEEDEAVHNMGEKVDNHLWAYATPSDPAGNDVSGEAIGKVVHSLQRHFKHVVIDGSASYTDAALAALDISDNVCLITGLDVVGVRHLSVALQTLLSLGYPTEKFRFVLNRADSKVGLSVENVERIMKLKVDGMIPSSRLVPVALNEGRTVVEQYPTSEVAKAVTALALKLAGAEQPVRKRKLFGR